MHQPLRLFVALPLLGHRGGVDELVGCIDHIAHGEERFRGGDGVLLGLPKLPEMMVCHSCQLMVHGPLGIPQGPEGRGFLLEPGDLQAVGEARAQLVRLGLQGNGPGHIHRGPPPSALVNDAVVWANTGPTGAARARNAAAMRTRPKSGWGCRASMMSSSLVHEGQVPVRWPGPPSVCP